MTKIERFYRFCESRSQLFNNVKNRLPGEGDDIYDISLHSIFDMFEFMYMLHVTNIDSAEKIQMLAVAHNKECERLLSLDQRQMNNIGVNKLKIKDSMFSDKNIKKLRSNYEFTSAIDQSDISRFLFKHMSRETTRKVIILFDRAKLVRRIDAGDSVLIQSNGQAEQVFEHYLNSLMDPPSGSDEVV